MYDLRRKKRRISTLNARVPPNTNVLKEGEFSEEMVTQCEQKWKNSKILDGSLECDSLRFVVVNKIYFGHNGVSFFRLHGECRAFKRISKYRNETHQRTCVKFCSKYPNYFFTHCILTVDFDFNFNET